MGIWARISSLFDTLVQQGLAKLPALVAAGLLFALFVGIAWLARRAVLRALERSNVEPTAHATVGRIVFFPLVVIGLALSLSEIDLSFASLGIELSLLGVGIGFALRDILTNFAAGVILTISRPFAPGDQIRVKEYEGTVESVGWRGTVLKTYDGRRVIIPNQDVFTSPVTNNTAFSIRRSSIFLGVGLQMNLTRATELARQALAKVPEVSSDPAPEVLVKVVGDFSVTLEIRIWSPAMQSDLLRVNSDATRAVKEAYDSQGIEMPFPTQVLHLKREGTHNTVLPVDA